MRSTVFSFLLIFIVGFSVGIGAGFAFWPSVFKSIPPVIKIVEQPASKGEPRVGTILHPDTEKPVVNIEMPPSVQFEGIPMSEAPTFQQVRDKIKAEQAEKAEQD